MQTRDANSLTNSVMLAMEKEFRKNGIAAVTHRHYTGNRQLIKGLIEIMLADLKPDDQGV